MKHYLDFVPQYEKVHRKNNRISVLCIALSVLLVTVIFSMADMALRAQKGYFIKTNGEYHISLRGIDMQISEIIGARIDVAACGWVYQGSTGTIGQKTVSFVGATETAFSTLTEMKMRSGKYPVDSNEALLNQAALEQLGLSIGETVVVTVPDGSQRAYGITGAFENLGSLLKADIYGMVLSEEGFCAIADDNAKEGTTFRIQFKNGVEIQSAIRQIKENYGLMENQVAENTALLGLMGQSKNSMMQSLYIVAVFLVLLVLAAGTVMITASFHTNVLERMQFYGLLRCLGASKKQVKHFVILQGLRQSFKGVPIGLIAGQIITWCACLLLKSISKERFSEIPLFQWSVSGLAAGVVIGFLIVFFASLSPARKAAKVSPITAVSGSTQYTQMKKAANTSFFSVETSMGIFHALSNRKNLVLMTCSFAISIIMFLSFQVLVVFLNQGMPALAPSAADISITRGSTPLDRTLVDKIAAIPNVANVFGRMEQVNIPVSANNGVGTITLISYDDRQLQWAKKVLNQGSIAPVLKNPASVLMLYQENLHLEIGDTLIVDTVSGEKQVTIAGILTTADTVNRAGSFGCIVCSEQTFIELAGDLGYAALDIQLSDANSDTALLAVRSIIPEDSSISDKRLSNAEAQSAYDTGAVFIYGFLIIIALITVFHIFNSMNASVASRIKQYGIMRSIGMGTEQLYKMIAAEALTYALLGCVVGCIFGLPFNKIMFQFLISDKWGIGWKVPLRSLLLIVVLCLASAAIAIRRPIKQISSMAIVDAVKDS